MKAGMILASGSLEPVAMRHGISIISFILGLIALAACAPESVQPQALSPPTLVASSTIPSTPREPVTTPPQPYNETCPTPIVEVDPYNLRPGLYLVTYSENTGLLVRSLQGELLGKLDDIDDLTASLSSDGNRVAYGVLRWGLEISNIYTGEIATIATDGGALDTSWAPDGTMLAFSTEPGWTPRGEDWGALNVADIQRGTTWQITFWWTRELSPAWSPDGRWIAFASDYPRDALYQNTEILILDASCVSEVETCAEKVRAVTPVDDAESAVDPAWSPDGTRLLYVCYSPHGGSADLCTIGLDGTGKRKLVESLGNEAGPAWSPDGKYLAFTRSFDALPIHRAYIANADGSGERLITGRADEVFVFWLPVP